MEGFGEQAQRYAERLRERARHIALLRYGFQFRKSQLAETTVSAPLQSVIERTRRHVEQSEDPGAAVIQGVEEGWEVCLLKFTFELIERSAGENVDNLRKRGLL